MEQTTTSSPIFLGFSSQKGGVGKSTLAEIISSILYYEKSIDLFVVDCDMTQDSFFKLREREKECIENDPTLKDPMHAYFARQGKPAYRIIKATPKDAITIAKERLQKQAVQLVVFDFPGHAGSRELLELSLEMDYILSPIEADVQSMVSCLTYAKTIQDLGVSMTTARIKKLIMLWNKVDRRVRNTLLEHYTQYIKEEGLSLMEAQVYATHRFSHELPQYGVRGLFRSTYMPPVKALRSGTGIDEVVEELLETINLQSKTAHDQGWRETSTAR